MNIVIPLSGRSSRFLNYGFKVPKFLLPLHDKRTMIEGAVDSLKLKGQLIFVVQTEHCDKYNIDVFLKDKYPNSIVTYLDHYTDGCVQSILEAAGSFINNNTPLIISNCDQYLEWDPSSFLNIISDNECDGCVLTYYANTNKNSYIRIDNAGNGIELREKKVISDNSLVGVHYWKKGCDFIESAENMINNNIRDNNEFYVSTSYNYLIQKGYKIKICQLQDNEIYHSIGVPETYYDFLQLKLPIELTALNTMTRGWLIGDFEPNIVRTKDYEVGILHHHEGEVWPAHLHKEADEINVLLKGRMVLNNIEINSGTIFKVPKGLLTKAKFIEDCQIVCIKTISNTKDKYNF
jgi:dTDP-glucose pyrophosphorylase